MIVLVNSKQIGLQFKFNKMSQKSVPVMWLGLLIIAIGLVGCQLNCGTRLPTLGCANCTSSAYTLVFDTSIQKYTCTNSPDLANCLVANGSACIQCISPFIINPSSGICVSSPGCLTYNNTECLQCDANYYLLTDGTCMLRSIQYCLQYDNTTTATTPPICTKCLHYSLDPATNCTISLSLCSSFDYQTMQCMQCPTGMRIHSDGLGCYSPVSNCLVYNSSSTSACLLCDDNYMLDTTRHTCELSRDRGVKYQLLSYTYNNSQLQSQTYQQECLDYNFAYSASTNSCSIAIANHCLTTSTTTSQCTQCAPGYYLNNNTCLECAIYMGYCVQCSDATVCTHCSDGYYVLNITTAQTKCMPCSAYKCATCSTQLNPQGKVQCLSCPINSTLYDGSCITCSSVGHAYSVGQSKCMPCNTISHCRFCQFTGEPASPIICLQCQQGYYLITTSTSCSAITSTTVVELGTAAQILPKSAPGIQKPLYNDRIALMSACYTVDGYVCNCNSINLTSLCTTFDYTPTITSLAFGSYSTVAQYSDQLRMAAQFPTFNYKAQMNFANSTTYQMLDQYQFWNVLSAYTYVITRNQAATDVPTSDTKDIIGKIFNLSTASMGKVFSDQKITILKGNGFYYKYIPTGLKSGSTGDDNYITTSLSSTQPVIIYVRFNPLQQTGFITGTIYIATNNTAAMAVKVRKTRYASYPGNNTLKYDGSLKNITADLTDGSLSIADFPKSTSAAPVGVQVYVNASDTTTDIYQAQRIQNIFYSESWLYILFFIALYLIFIPLCAIVDCCEPDHIMRKKVGSEEQGPENDSEDITIVRVNYRDFFPLYNVGNTPRPRRLTKVCLFIVNMQHIITFLTLIYFNLPGGLPVAAIALVIPGYLCTVFMGYIVGALFRLLPGNFKYLINLFSLGYWILWIFLMRIMNNNGINSRDYRLYILVFSILSFFLDMVIDALETLLVYFAIKQGEKQVSLFNCLAQWLSLRGYYEFDKLAKQLGDPDE